jgi:hypothetical protein
VKKPVRLNQKELDKFIKVLGLYQVKMLYAQNKISITPQVLNYLASLKEEDI